MQPDHKNTERSFKPQRVIDVENHKRFFESHGYDWCKVCPERYKLVTGIRRCVTNIISVETKPFVDSLSYDIRFKLSCFIEGKFVGVTRGSIGDEEVTRFVSLEDLRSLYAIQQQT